MLEVSTLMKRNVTKKWLNEFMIRYFYNRKDIYCELCKTQFPDLIRYNGTLYKWEFYTGNFVGTYPEGIDLMLKVSGLREGKYADTYFINDSRPAKSNGVSPFEIKEINGAKWYTCNNGTIYYYGAEFMGNIYEIEIKNGKVINGITLESVTNMLEKTLFFE